MTVTPAVGRWQGLMYLLLVLLLRACLVTGCAGLFVTSAQATPLFLTQALVDTPHEQTVEVTLPYFVWQTHSGLMQVRWALQLTSAIHRQRLPALLIPQPVQGMTVKVGEQTVFTLEASTARSNRTWYRPVLIPLPQGLFESAIPPRVYLEQTGHLRGWYIAPVLQGELSELQSWHDRFMLLSSTLPTTVNALSMLVGFFVLLIGWRTQSITYLFGGLTTVIWGVLFSLALVSEWPADAWFAWRLLLYFFTGNLIYCAIRFMWAIFHLPLSRSVHLSFFGSLQLGWVLFALSAGRLEATLDIVWTGVAVGLYALGSAIIVWRGLQRHEGHKVLALGAHGALTALLAVHDYVLQAGYLPHGWIQALPQPWYTLLLQPIYLTHLALPVFVLVSLWLLAHDHLQHREAKSRHALELIEQREQIVSDIHDGVGARLNLMLWRVRTQPLAATQLQDELERSIEELRFAINPQQTGHLTLATALKGMCARFERMGQVHGIAVTWHDHTGELPLRPEQGLHLYKAAHECVSNAFRHSGASCVDITLFQRAPEVILRIQDNGKGIPDWDEATQRQDPARPTAMGLRGLGQRLQPMGGRVHISSNAEGTQIDLQLPIDVSAALAH